MAQRIASKKSLLKSALTAKFGKVSISGRKAFIAFLLFGTLFGAQLKMSRQFRLRSLQLLHWLLFAATASGFGAALIVVMTKMAKRRRKIQEIKK